MMRHSCEINDHLLATKHVPLLPSPLTAMTNAAKTRVQQAGRLRKHASVASLLGRLSPEVPVLASFVGKWTATRQHTQLATNTQSSHHSPRCLRNLQ